MTTSQLIDHITARPRWYEGKYKQQTASHLVKRIRSGSATINKQIEFFGKFGYVLDRQEWTQQETR